MARSPSRAGRIAWVGRAGRGGRARRASCATSARACCCPASSTRTATSSCRTSPAGCRSAAASCRGWRRSSRRASGSARTRSAARPRRSPCSRSAARWRSATSRTRSRTSATLAALAARRGRLHGAARLGPGEGRGEPDLGGGAGARRRRAAAARASRSGWRPTRRTRSRPSCCGCWSTRGGPAAIHLAESPDESRFLLDGSGGWPAFLARPRARPRRLRGPRGEPGAPPRGAGRPAPAPRRGALRAARRGGPRAAGAPRRARRAVSAQQPQPRASAVPTCRPCSRSGVRLALGTDSLASVDTLDVLDDAVLLHRELPGCRAGHDRAHGDRGRRRGAGARRPRGAGARAAARLAYAPRGDRPADDPHDYLLSGEARLQTVTLVKRAGCSARRWPTGG